MLLDNTFTSFLSGHYTSRNANKNFMTTYLDFNGVEFFCIPENKKLNKIQFQISVDWRLVNKISATKWMHFCLSILRISNSVIMLDSYFLRLQRVFGHTFVTTMKYIAFWILHLYRTMYRYVLNTRILKHSLNTEKVLLKMKYSDNHF